MSKAVPVRIPLSKLRVGITVKLPLSWTNHPFLFNRVEIESAAQIELIKSLNVPYVTLLSGDEPLEDEVPSAQRQSSHTEVEAEVDAKKQVRKSLRLGQQRFTKSANESRASLGKVVSDPEGAYRSVSGQVEELLLHLQQVETPFLSLVNAGEDVSVTQHGVSVAVLAMMIGNALELPPAELRDIAMGALFHDIGKLKVPDVIRRKKSGLTDHEINFMKMHPKFGYDMMDKSGLFPPAVLDIVLHHHEWIDGTGYPDRLKKEQIPLTTQVVCLANDFEGQLRGGNARSPQVALGYLFKNRASKHAEKLISTLVKVLGIYPPGTLVSLSDGQVGKVIMTTKEVKQPYVWSCDLEGEKPALRFLNEEGVLVDKVIKLDELSNAAIKALEAEANISFYFSAL